VTDCENEPIGGLEIIAWKNQWRPFHLPLQLGTTYTDSEGSFTLETMKKASFFTHDGYRLTFDSHPRESESRCEQVEQ